MDLYVPAGPATGSGIPWIVEELQLFSIAQLPCAQAGYRWTGPQRAPLPGWAPNWVVIAAALADPYLVDVHDPELAVYGARHGTGRWTPHRVAPSG